jgi:hypothetical protein
MKKICRNCHFLGKQHLHQVHDEGVSFYLHKNERILLERNDVELNSANYAIRCLMGVWDQRFYESNIPMLEIVNNTQRDNTCFFYPYNEGTTFEVAKELEKRAQENMQLKRSNKYTRIGLWVAAGALAINALVGIIRLLKCA